MHQQTFIDLEVLDLFTFNGGNVLYQYDGVAPKGYAYRNFDTGQHFCSATNQIVKPITVV